MPIARLLVIALMLAAGSAHAARESNISVTPHNLSSSEFGSVSTSSTDEICVFCHTPHGASTAVQAPLWNRSLSDRADSLTGYQVYSSSSLDYRGDFFSDPDISTNSAGENAYQNAFQPSGNSKLCLSCHDGTVAIGSVTNAPGSGLGSDIEMVGTAVLPLLPGSMPPGEGENTGFTRRIGTDLTNDHPISFEYTSSLATADGELVNSGVTAGAKSGGSDHIVVTAPVGANVDGSVTKAGPGQLPLQHLDGEALMQCTTCHDPHISDPAAEAANVSIKFLRQNRFQDEAGALAGTETFNAEPGAVFDPGTDITCLACHDKAGWEGSAHADPTVADERYNTAAATLREFPHGGADTSKNIRVWQASCLNCHDTHSVQGSRRLLREGVEGNSTTLDPKPGFDAATTGYNDKSAIEETCYQCHTGDGGQILEASSGTGAVPDIETEFGRLVTMPITTSDQRGDAEQHEIRTSLAGNSYIVDCTTDPCAADFMETEDNLGATDNLYRHVECTDCHNPHRVIRNSRFNADDLDDDSANDSSSRRFHVAGLNDTAATGTDGQPRNDGSEGNVASGVLRGSWGVEPTGDASGHWPKPIQSFAVKRGEPVDDSVSRDENTKHLTREYQLCFKCHSEYGSKGLVRTFDTNTYAEAGPFGLPDGTGPALGGHSGGTPSGTNYMTHYTNIAAEFLSVNATDPPTSGGDQGEQGRTGKACDSDADRHVYNNGAGDGDCDPTPSLPGDNDADNSDDFNHRSWHPVVWPTGRDRDERSMGGGEVNLRAPFVDRIGTGTMTCSDCHGADGSWTTNTGPDPAQVQGPHGSERPYLLKGAWTVADCQLDGFSNCICGNCHNPTANATASGFGGDHRPDDKMGGEPCNYCHIVVPHGWKNKAFLANLYCVGPEAWGAGGGNTDGSGSNTITGTCQSLGGYSARTYPPYYRTARLRVETWARSGSWNSTACGGGSMEDNCPRTGD